MVRESHTWSDPISRDGGVRFRDLTSDHEDKNTNLRVTTSFSGKVMNYGIEECPDTEVKIKNDNSVGFTHHTTMMPFLTKMPLLASLL